jgi:elongation factor Ts
MSNITAAMVKELREVTGAGMMDCKKALTECNGDFEEAKEFLRKKGQAIANKKSSRETKEGSICIAENDNKSALIKIACETDFVAKNDQFKSFIKEMADQALEVGTDNFPEKSSSKGSIKDQFVEIISKLGENIVYLEGIDWEAPANSIIGSYAHTNSKIGVLVELAADQAVENASLKEVARNLAMHIAASQVEAIQEDDLDSAVVEKERKFLIEQAKESGKPENIIEKMVEGRMVKYKREICLLYQNYVKEPDKTIEQYLEGEGKRLGAKLSVTRFYKNQF